METDYDSFLRVFDDGCNLVNQIAGNDDFCGLQSELSFASDGTTTYTIMVEGFGTSSGNFSLAVTCESSVVVIDTFPYQESFEAGDGGWTTAGTLWELGTPAGLTIIGASDGVNAWATDLDGLYPNNAFETVVSPLFDFTGFTDDPEFRMDVWWSSESSWDGTVLESSIDGGTTWQQVGAFGRSQQLV